MLILLPHRTALVGQPVYVRVRDDIPLEVFAKGLPGIGRADSDREGWERWVNDLVSYSLEAPLLSADEVNALGGIDRQAIGDELLRAWGLPGHQDALPTFREIYASDFLAIVRRLSRAVHMLPTEIMKLTAREFWINYTVLFGPGSEPDEDDVRANMFGGSFAR